ncbi:hypothetical protein K504DRAFT_461147 [Pleomassaria siparia CBS 279.74]|uniref:Peptidase S59 domain-containing protein n=1 Tax=Pleomassaria siparia CBS 279.74 TaxID=1314801 RepID=A0A6G1JVT2_9PLEO|nr:hypothetical protein K504DRAFT_461147 [Pleomassaria siparia CBS 279.74]
MSFGFGSGGGFGSNNNNNQQPAFGGFGAGNNTNTGFGSNTNSNTGSIFGNNAGTNAFGTNNASTSSPFGGGGAFGANNNKPTTAFGSTPFSGSTGGLFGGGASGSAFGGFNNTPATNNTTSAFGGGNQSGGLFGANKPAFGAGATGTGTNTLFGGGNTGGGFGTTNTNTGFGATNTTGFGAQQANQTPQPNNGTAGTPFNSFTEKDASGTQNFQTITFQDPYKGFSLEELRAVDYNAGRRFGNQNGQAGAFGQSTGFGGFGAGNTTASTGFGSNTASTGGLFGANTSTPATSAFGGGNTTSVFGGSTNTSGGGLFGNQNKPAGGLFGGAATSQPAASGGLFGGGSTANTGAFGAGTGGFGNTNTAAGGLFGNTQQNQNTPKPFGGFGANTTTPAATNPFGGTTSTAFGGGNTGGGLFGGGQQNQAAATPAFGANQQAQQPAAGGLFGGGGGAFGAQQNQQTQAQGQTGGLFGGFGNTQQTQQKPAGGLFGAGATPAAGGLFSGGAQQQQQQQQQQPATSLFGNSGAQPQTGGLFASKPAATGGLFGGAGNTGTATGGLFGGGATQNAQQNTGGLFGNQNQAKPGGLFGGSTTNTNSGGLFGGLGGQNTGNSANLGSSLFSSQNQQQQPQQSGMGGSLFGASGNSLLQTSMNTNPYGNDTLFAGLTTPTQSPGPLATPLSSSQKNKKSAILPQSKLNPSASTRLLTPQNRRPNGYGFTYSTYGTPNSASSNPGLSGSLFGGSSMSLALGKSMSTSNLRNSYNPETSILAPGAFSTTGRPFVNGSLKKLNINRSINNRPPLFEPSQDKKRVSFAAQGVNDDVTTNGNGTNGTDNSALVRLSEPENESSSESSSTMNGGASKPPPQRQEMEQVNGDSTRAPAPEPRILRSRVSSLNSHGPNGKSTDPKGGDYWSEPSIEELQNMSREQLRSVVLTVGRHDIGRIEFNRGRPIDLTSVNINKLFGDIVQLNLRNATVYGEATSVPKPALGTGLNHASRITLANSWPRNKAGRKDQKHLERLKRVTGTTYENYDPSSGEWTFIVPHFSTYGLNDSDSSDDEEEEEESSELSSVPDTPAQANTSQMTGTPQDDSLVSPMQSSPDDTFDFKKDKRIRASVPGGFGDEVGYEEDADIDMSMTTTGKSFLGERSVGSLDGQHDCDYSEEGESELVEDQNMVHSVSSPVQTTEQPIAKRKESDPFKDSIMPKSILKAGQTLRPAFGTPSKGHLMFDDDWANQLQRTISPKKQDRHALRESQGDVLRKRDLSASVANAGQSFGTTAIPSRFDLYESLFGDADKESPMSKRTGHGIELPYSKRPKTSHELDQLSDDEKAFHSCNKPYFSETGTLLYTNKLGPSTLEGGIFATVQEPIIGTHKDVRFTKLPTFPDATPQTLNPQKAFTLIDGRHSIPVAIPKYDLGTFEFSQFANEVDLSTAAGVHEKQAWDLLSVLFDEDDRHKVPDDLTRELLEQHKEQYRKDKLSDFWQSLVSSDAEKHVQQAQTPEEKAIAYLSGYNIPDACHALLKGQDMRLATMVSQINEDEHMRHDVLTQIEEWRRMDVLSEIDESVRTIYELLSGNCGFSQGKSGAGRENKAPTFNISGQFGLDWRRSFGLRLWYGALTNEPIEMAVAQFADALRDGGEEAHPRPWFVEQNVDMGWKDKHPQDREDLLWGILKLYASAKLDLPANIEDVLAPENVSGHPLNARLSWQLFQLFKIRQQDPEESDERIVAMPTARQGDGFRESFVSPTTPNFEKDAQAENALVELGDKLTLTYASSLHTKEHWTTALWVYTHLSSPANREHYIRALLAQFSSTYSLREGDATYAAIMELRIPEEWVQGAAALQAKAEGDTVRQVMHLIKAKELEEAHEVLRCIVGPEAIIAREYDTLRELLGNFLPDAPSSPTGKSSVPQKNTVKGWGQGGQIYFEYIELMDLSSQRSNYRVDEELEERIQTLLSTLQHALEITARDRWETCRLEERVALTEIAGKVADLSAKNKYAERARVLKLPLTEDLWLRHSSDLSLGYYRAVMASGK